MTKTELNHRRQHYQGTQKDSSKDQSILELIHKASVSMEEGNYKIMLISN